jgi:hypothetical protein
MRTICREMSKKKKAAEKKNKYEDKEGGMTKGLKKEDEQRKIRKQKEIT